jgi:LysM repeat protein
MPGSPARRPKAVVIRTRRKPKGQKKMFAAVALVAYLVQPGDTLSGIAASHGVSLAAVEAANPQLSDSTLVYAGQTIEIPEGSSASLMSVEMPAGSPASQGWSTPQGSTPQGWSTSQGWSTPQGFTAPESGGQSSSSPSSPSSIAGASSASSPSSIVGASSASSPSSIAGAVTQTSSSGSSGTSSSDLSDVPGVPQSLAACVAFRESTDLQNPAADGNAYGIIPASGYNVAGTSLAYQKQVFAELYKQDGGAPWAADGCPGT